jgi:hypothetical protein
VLAIDILKHSKNNHTCEVFKVILNDYNISVANGIQYVGIALKNTLITTIATNSYNLSDFELQAS